MSLNSNATVASSPDSTDCCLLDGDCKCYRPQKDCKYLGKKVFFGKKGGRLTKEEKLKDLWKQLRSLDRKGKTIANKQVRVEGLIEEVKGKE